MKNPDERNAALSDEDRNGPIGVIHEPPRIAGQSTNRMMCETRACGTGLRATVELLQAMTRRAEPEYIGWPDNWLSDRSAVANANPGMDKF